EVLVPEDDARLGRRTAFVHVQVRSADRGRCDPYDHVARMLDLWVVDVPHGHTEGLLIDDGFHLVTSASMRSMTAATGEPVPGERPRRNGPRPAPWPREVSLHRRITSR